MKRAVIVINGDLSNIKNVTFLPDDFVICTDGATEKVLKRNIIPSVVIGDFDSISGKTIQKLTQKKVPMITYPSKKDKSDSELSIEFAYKKKYKQIVICGLLGRRLDHMLANILLLGRNIIAGCDITIVDYNIILYSVRKEKIIIGKKNDIVSLLPITKQVEGVTTNGLSYTLNNATLYFGSTRGISNYLTSNKAQITIKKGVLLVAHEHRDLISDRKTINT
ncbi:thiamine diphosphokinase [Candidatus Roizmanbacteria bacterium RIFCSPHIGHO2_02_FULL_37_13b]|nr:MAG: thiamine diphosphokinase [Candidatus Roizmanbacteria bacterium RIFCSPHIGHO2_02_FULL_37_13b]